MMSDYASVAEHARKVFASLARLERKLEQDPEDRATAINLAATRKRANQAREEMERLASLSHIEVCEYRIVPADERGYRLNHVSKSLFEYQNLFSQIYDSIKSGKKTKAQIGRDAAEESALEFAYTYSGSLGVALLAQSDRDFFSGTLDTAIDALYEIIDINDASSVHHVADKLGRAVVKRVHDWSKANVDGGFSADVRWKRSDGRMLGQMIDVGRMERIVGFIEAASDKGHEVIDVQGLLVAVSLPNQSFQIVVPDGPTYTGHFSDDFVVPDELTVGRFYDAKIERTEIVYYATQQEKVTYSLMGLSGPQMSIST